MAKVIVRPADGGGVISVDGAPRRRGGGERGVGRIDVKARSWSGFGSVRRDGEVRGEDGSQAIGPASTLSEEAENDRFKVIFASSAGGMMCREPDKSGRASSTEGRSPELSDRAWLDDCRASLRRKLRTVIPRFPDSVRISSLGDCSSRGTRRIKGVGRPLDWEGDVGDVAGRLLRRKREGSRFAGMREVIDLVELPRLKAGTPRGWDGIGWIDGL